MRPAPVVCLVALASIVGALGLASPETAFLRVAPLSRPPSLQSVRGAPVCHRRLVLPLVGKVQRARRRFALSNDFALALGVNSGLALLGKVRGQRWLTPQGLLHAWFLGVTLWSTLGVAGWALCVLYLIGGSLVTKVKQAEKEALGIAEKRGGARGPENVWGSAAAGTICALASVVLPTWRRHLQVAYVASLATKLSDTFASEVGKAYGKRTFLITTLKPVPRGTEGAISVEGTLAGVGGSLLIAAAGVLLRLMPTSAVAAVLIAAFVATNIESVLGASLQNDKHPWATNEFINFLNTAIGAALALAQVALAA